MNFLCCYVFFHIFYGVDSWTLTEVPTRKFEAFEMWLYRRILRMSWMDQVKTIHQRMNEAK